jgi:hypothetical protein
MTAQVSQTDNYIRGIACISAQAPRVLSATVELKHTDTGTLTITMEACAYGDALDAGDCTDVYAFLQLWGLLQNSVMLPQPEPIEIEIKRFGVTDTGIMIGGALFLHNATAKDGSPRFDVEHIDVQEIAEDFEDLTDEQLADAISYLHDTYHDKELLPPARLRFANFDETENELIVCVQFDNTHQSHHIVHQFATAQRLRLRDQLVLNQAPKFALLLPLHSPLASVDRSR